MREKVIAELLERMGFLRGTGSYGDAENVAEVTYDAAIEEAARVADRLTYSPNGASIAAAVRKLKGERNG